MIQKDKILHLGCSFIITLVFGLLFGIIPGIAIGLVVGIAKEVYDKYIGTTGFDFKDLLFDVFGIAIATLILLLV